MTEPRNTAAGPEPSPVPPNAADLDHEAHGSLIGSQIVSAALEGLALDRKPAAFGTALRVNLKALAACAPEAFPGLRRGMIVTVNRPWSTFWSSPVWSVVAARIRHHEGRILGHPATEHHAMIYAGQGRCWSQDFEFGLTPLSKYKGCTLTFWDMGWNQVLCNRLVAEAGVHAGSGYACWDIAMILAWSLTGVQAALAAQDRDSWICSEAVCELCRKILAEMFGPGECLAKVPQALADWLAARNTPRLVLIPA